MTNKSKVVFSLTEEMHMDLANIYEAIVDEDSTAFSKIDELRSKLKALKDNLTKTSVV